MKVFSKIAVIAAALMLVSVFVSCKNDAEEGPGVVAEFVSDGDNMLGVKLTCTCYDDDSFDIVLDDAKDIKEAKEFVGETLYMGTYKGDPTKKNGEIEVVMTHGFNGKEQVEYPEKQQIKATVEIVDDVLLLPFGYFDRVKD